MSGKEFLHSHVHKHADGTVHSHYHSHLDGDLAHSHDDAVGESDIAFDPHAEVHAEGVMPVHAHEGFVASEAPLRASALTYAYRNSAEPVFTDLDLEVEAGAILAILGNNGAGKSTLLNLLAGIEKPTSGNVWVNGVDVATLSRKQVARHLAYVAQQQTVPHLSVFDEVLLGRRPHISWGITDVDRQITARAISDLGLESYTQRFCDELSGGERQKVFIARALAQEPHIMLFDEPTSALDPKNQLEVLSVIRKITHRDRLATVVVLHDINLALRFCDRFMLIRDGSIVAHGGIDVVTDEALSTTYDTGFKVTMLDGMPIAVPVSDFL